MSLEKDFIIFNQCVLNTKIKSRYFALAFGGKHDPHKPFEGKGKVLCENDCKAKKNN